LEKKFVCLLFQSWNYVRDIDRGLVYISLGNTSTHLERDDVYRACSLHDPVKIKNDQIERRESKRTFTYEE
jgi:hypothetical protein